MNLKLGSHVSMSGKSMLLGSAKEAESYGANTFMFYTGAPQNTKRKEISELNIDAAWNYMNEKNISDIVVHAPYIINLGNTVKPETYELAVEFLAKEIDRAAACKSQTLILHPGAHVGAGVETGLQQVIKGLNEVLTKDTPLHIALEPLREKIRLRSFILTTVKMCVVQRKTGMPISALEKLDSMPSPISYTTRILNKFRKSLKLHIFLLQQKRRNLTHHTNMRLQC